MTNVLPRSPTFIIAWARSPLLWGEAPSTTDTGSPQITPAGEQQSRTGEIPFPKKPLCGCAQGLEGPQVPRPPNWAGLPPSKAMMPSWFESRLGRLRGQAAPSACIHRGYRNGKDVEPAMMRRVRMNPPS